MSKIATCVAVVGLMAANYAQAQTVPPGFSQGDVPTAAQWTAAWSSKQDFSLSGSITAAQIIAALTYVPLNKGGDTMLGELITIAPTTSAAGFVLPPGTAPSSPPNGATWTTSAGLFVQINGATIGPIGTGSGGTPGGTSNQIQYNNGGAFGGFTQSGDCTTVVSTGVTTCGPLFHLSSNNTSTGVNTFAAIAVARRTVTANTTLSATTDNIVCGNVTGGAITLTMPPGTGSGIPNGLSFGIDDCFRLSATSTLTVAANSGQTISGGASIAIITNGGSVNPVWNSTTNNWDLF